MPKQPLPSNKSAVLATWALLGGPAILARGVKSACFAAARGGHPRLAAACHAASARSRACGARPDVENTQHGTFTASVRARKSQIPAKIGRIATRTVATAGLPRRTAARHAACAGSPRGVRHGLTSAGPVLSTHARVTREHAGWEMGLVELGGRMGSTWRPRITFWASIKLHAPRTAACVESCPVSSSDRCAELRHCDGGSAVCGRARDQSYNPRGTR